MAALVNEKKEVAEVKKSASIPPIVKTWKRVLLMPITKIPSMP